MATRKLAGYISRRISPGMSFSRASSDLRRARAAARRYPLPRARSPRRRHPSPIARAIARPPRGAEGNRAPGATRSRAQASPQVTTSTASMARTRRCPERARGHLVARDGQTGAVSRGRAFTSWTLASPAREALAAAFEGKVGAADVGARQARNGIVDLRCAVGEDHRATRRRWTAPPVHASPQPTLGRTDRVSGSHR